MSTLKNYTIENLIGKGGMGKVYLVKTKDGQRRALKQVSLTLIMDDQTALKSAHNEVKLMEKFGKHRNIVHIYISFEDCGFTLLHSGGSVDYDRGDTCLYMEMEYCGGRNLHHKIAKAQTEKKHFDEDKVMSWFVDLTSAVKFLHRNGIVHRDIKSQNVLFSSDGSILKLGDFGVAKLLNSSECKPAGTISHMAPETYDPRCKDKAYKPDFKEDIWALGVILFEMAALELPYRGSDPSELMGKVLWGQRAPLPIGLYSSELERIIDHLLIHEPSERWDIEKLTTDSHFRGFRTRNYEKMVEGDKKLLRNEIAQLRQEIESLKTSTKVQSQKDEAEMSKLRKANELLLLENKHLKAELLAETQRFNEAKKDWQRELNHVEAKWAGRRDANKQEIQGDVTKSQVFGLSLNLMIASTRVRISEYKGQQQRAGKQVQAADPESAFKLQHLNDALPEQEPINSIRSVIRGSHSDLPTARLHRQVTTLPPLLISKSQQHIASEFGMNPTHET